MIIDEENRFMMVSGNNFIKEKLRNLPFCFPNPFFLKFITFSQTKRSFTNIAVETQPVFKKTSSHSTFVKTLLPFFSTRQQFLQNKARSLCSLQKKRYFISFLSLFVLLFLLILEWFR